MTGQGHVPRRSHVQRERMRIRRIRRRGRGRAELVYGDLSASAETPLF